MSDVTNHSGIDIGEYIKALADSPDAQTHRSPVERIATALERLADAQEHLVLVVATLLPGDGEAPEEPQETVHQTSSGPMVVREGKWVPLD